jgi:hexosaminidase
MGEDESYRLHTNHSGSYLTSSTLTGFIRGLSTYVQLIETEKRSADSVVPHVLINDRARFVWCGLMLDVCRHWIPMRAVQRTLDAMEMSKLIVLHLHLSDDQGFRVESIRYPLLHDRQSYFTQAEIRNLVEYARQRRIRIIPEFDIPGHTTR